MERLTIAILLMLGLDLVTSHPGQFGGKRDGREEHRRDDREGRKHDDREGCKHDGRDGRQPNIVWIMADDLGFHDIGIRNPDVITPNMDALASKGVTFSNNYVQAVCSPSRHALMTGRYPYTSSMQFLVIQTHEARCTGLEYKLLPEYLKDLGYQTHAVGKWHLGYCRDECLPTSRGFNTFFGLYEGAGDYWNHTLTGLYDWHTNDQVNFDVRGVHSQNLEVDHLDQIFDDHDEEEPLFLYFAPQNPHTPSQPTQEFLDMYSADEFDDVRRKYLALTSGLDSMVGKIVEKLEEKDMMDNTYIVFVADNGADPGEGSNAPFRGGKGSAFEGGTKSNSFIYSPLLKKTGYENDGLMHIVDWMPTLVKLAGGKVDDDIDGIDQSKMVTRGAKSKRKNMVYMMDREHHIAPAFMGEIAVRNERYKLIWGFPGWTDGYDKDLDFIYNIPYYHDLLADNKRRKKRSGPYTQTPEERQFVYTAALKMRVSDEDLANGTGYMQLYDLQEDPYEKNNLAEDAEHQIVLQELIQFVREEYENKYKSMAPELVVHHPLSEVNPNGYVEPGWCQDLFPPPG